MTKNKSWGSICAIFVTLIATRMISGQELTLAKIFPNDRVLDIRITVDDDDWESIRYQRRNLRDEFSPKRQFAPIESPYTYIKGKIVIDGVEFDGVGIRKKGFLGSQSSTRPSFKVKLDFSEKNVDIDGLSSLTLNNNKQDLSLVSQFMGYAFFEDVGLPAPRCSFAHLTFNGKDFGVYCHVESARKPMVENGFGNSTGTLFEGTVNDFHKDWENGFDRKFGDNESGRKLIKQLSEALDGLKSQPGEEIDVEETVTRYVNLEQFYRFWAVESLLGFWDGYAGNRNNFFIYVNPDDNKIHFLPWGGDCMFQKFSMIDRDPRLPVSVKTKGLLAYWLYHTENGRERYRDTLLSIIEGYWDEAGLLQEIDRIEAMVKPFLSKSQRRTAKSDSVRKFIRTRKQEIMDEIADGMPDWNRRPGRPPVISEDSNFGRRRGEDLENIWSAAKNGDTELIAEQLKKGIKVDQRSPAGRTPLIMAALSGKTSAAQYLLKAGADVNAKGKNQNTAIHSAAFLGHIAFVKLLVENDVDFNVTNGDGNTPLDVASLKWSQIADFVAGTNQSLNLRLDLSKMKANRSDVAEFLRNLGAKSNK